MIFGGLKEAFKKAPPQAEKAYIRNLLKESLQFYILNFVYSSPAWKNLIFTGGTCLRRCYGSPRLSEDIDLNIEEKKFDFDAFINDINAYFSKKLQFRELNINFRPKNQILFLKFPVLSQLGFAAPSESNVLFVRVDFSLNLSKIFKTETNLISGPDFSFLVRNYDLPTLFANKIVAFLEREFKKGKLQKEPFKGRDVFDLAWFIQKSREGGGKLRPNFARIKDLTKIKTAKELREIVIAKIKKIEKDALIEDLRPFFPDFAFVQDFSQTYQRIIEKGIAEVLNMSKE